MYPSVKEWRRYYTYQAVEEVHHDDDDEEDECEEEEVADGRLDGEVAELELAHEHGEGLHHREVQRVEEGVVVGRVLLCVMRGGVRR